MSSASATKESFSKLYKLTGHVLEMHEQDWTLNTDLENPEH
jgi:hypothetical protein